MGIEFVRAPSDATAFPPPRCCHANRARRVDCRHLHRPGRGGVGVVAGIGNKVSHATAILGRLPPPRHATYCRFLDADGATLDEGIALVFARAAFRSPASMCLELQAMVAQCALNLILQRLRR